MPFAVIIDYLDASGACVRGIGNKPLVKKSWSAKKREVTETVGAGNAAGMVFVHGELWRAAAPAGVSIPQGRARARQKSERPDA